jgi:hypothetical protein
MENNLEIARIIRVLPHKNQSGLMLSTATVYTSQMQGLDEMGYESVSRKEWNLLEQRLGSCEQVASDAQLF